MTNIPEDTNRINEAEWDALDRLAVDAAAHLLSIAAIARAADDQLSIKSVPCPPDIGHLIRAVEIVAKAAMNNIDEITLR